MNATLVNDWWMTTDSGGQMGTTDTSGITDKQKHNAQKIYDYFNALGWSLSAIAGMLGNMQVESWLSPALIQSAHRSELPNSASNLSDVPNNVMINFYGSSNMGIGLVQWDGYTSTAPAGQKLVSFAERYNLTWYDGDTQCYRIQREQETNLQFVQKTIDGYTWNWNNYITTNKTPEEACEAFRQCYENGGASSIERRKQNARYWYDYFSETPPTPDDWITGTVFSSLATAYDPDITGQQIPYTQMDCYEYVQTVWRDIQAVSASDKLCNPVSQWGTAGTNTLWRQNISPYPTWTFDTTSPDNQNPTPVLWWKGSIAECESQYGEIPAGALLFHKIGEDDNPQIPNYYRGDGIGNFAHVGIYIGNNEVMQSGGRDSGSVPGGGVHRSAYDSSAWNYVAFVVYVDPTGSGPTPPPPPPPSIRKWLLFWYTDKQKEVLKNVKRIF